MKLYHIEEIMAEMHDTRLSHPLICNVCRYSDLDVLPSLKFIHV